MMAEPNAVAAVADIEGGWWREDKEEGSSSEEDEPATAAAPRVSWAGATHGTNKKLRQMARTVIDSQKAVEPTVYSAVGKAMAAARLDFAVQHTNVLVLRGQPLLQALRLAGPSGGVVG